MESRDRYIITILTVVCLVLGGAFLYQRNNMQLLQHQTTEQDNQIEILQHQLNLSTERLNQYNTTLISLEAIPLINATNMIIERVGIEYFNKYFSDPTSEITEYDQNVTLVTYKYHIEIGNYSTTSDVRFYFHPKYTMVFGLPIVENLQPFTVTSDEAKQYALAGGLPNSSYPLEAFIQYSWIGDVYPLQGYEEKYYWEIISWRDPPWARSRLHDIARVDALTGQVYPMSWGGSGLSESQVDTAEEAAAHGLDGYIKLSYPELPEHITLAKNDNVTFTIHISYVSYNESHQQAELIIDPYYVDPYMVQSNLADKLRDYVTYQPNGVLSVMAGEVLDVTVTVRVPDDVLDGLTFNTWALDGLGIASEGVLILSG